MEQGDKIFVAGHRGLVGSAIVRQLKHLGYHHVCFASHKELDLCDRAKTDAFFKKEKPRYLFMCAAKVGGILANNDHPADFICQNIAIAQNTIMAAHAHQVERVLFLGSSCIYPKLTPQPMEESALLTGPLEITNRPYAIAKIAGIEMCSAFNRQYGTQFLAAMPTNLYGPEDNYHLTHSHVLPALIRKCHEAKLSSAETLYLWGTGTPRRDFLYSDDLADACIFLMNLPDSQFNSLLKEGEFPIVNVGYGADMSIKELAEMVKTIVGYQGKIAWDSAKPDGTPRKLMNSQKIQRLGWRPKTDIIAGVKQSYADYLQRYAANHVELLSN